MNEQVKQLWAKAAKSNFGDSWEEQTKFMERFAELIVRECILTIQMGITRDGHNTEQYQRSIKHIKQIKEHFGIDV